MYQQYAHLPFQFRLSQWKGDFLNKEEKKTVMNYITKGKKTKSTGNHILIYGTVQEGKYNLGVAIANELALEKQTCSYVTATKLYSDFFQENKNFDCLWEWNTSKFLIIDDVIPDKTNFTKPSECFEYYNISDAVHKKNKEMLLNTNIIWVLNINRPYQKEEWTNYLTSIGVSLNNISIVNLSY